jgi:enoyl-CoA hydratase/carnithine racemase
VTCAGRAFCAGADLASQTGNPAGEFPGSFWDRPTVNSFESGWEIFKPVIAAVNGYCLGYGLALVALHHCSRSPDICGRCFTIASGSEYVRRLPHHLV